MSEFDRADSAIPVEEISITEPILVGEADEIPPPPRWLKRLSKWFRVGLGVFILLSVLLSVIGCSHSVFGVPWQQATAVAPAAVIEQTIAQNTTLTGEQAAKVAKTMQAWEVRGKLGRLVVFNFNTPELCGALGCLYMGMWLRENQPAAQVLSMYLNPNLPEGRSLFEVLGGEGDRNRELPCLKVMQLEQVRLRQINLCFNGRQYQIVNSQLYNVTDKL
jgi:hypothetical protein